MYKNTVPLENNISLDFAERADRDLRCHRIHFQISLISTVKRLFDSIR